MDRRYYGLKALILGVAISAAVLGGGLECSHLARVHNPNYEAAYIAEAAVHAAGLKAAHTLGLIFSRAFATL